MAMLPAAVTAAASPRMCSIPLFTPLLRHGNAVDGSDWCRGFETIAQHPAVEEQVI
jgi:hypothetical protein